MDELWKVTKQHFLFSSFFLQNDFVIKSFKKIIILSSCFWRVHSIFIFKWTNVFALQATLVTQWLATMVQGSIICESSVLNWRMMQCLSARQFRLPWGPVLPASLFWVSQHWAHGNSKQTHCTSASRLQSPDCKWLVEKKQKKALASLFLICQLSVLNLGKCVEQSKHLCSNYLIQ